MRKQSRNKPTTNKAVCGVIYVVHVGQRPWRLISWLGKLIMKENVLTTFFSSHLRLLFSKSTVNLIEQRPINILIWDF